MVRARGSHHCGRPIFPFDPLDLASDDIGCLVPTDLLVARFSSFCAVTFSSRVEINPFEGMQQSCGRIDHRTPGKRIGREGGFPGWRKLSTPRLDDPGWS